MKSLSLAGVIALAFALGGCHVEICGRAQAGWALFALYNNYADVSAKDQRNIERLYDATAAYCAGRGIPIPPRA